jgi:hypothetical protein
MKVYVATLVDLENTSVVGVYSTEDLALGKLEKAMEELYFSNEDYGVYPYVIEAHIDDVDQDEYV